MNDKVLCHTPTPGKKPTAIDRWKYDAIRRAVLAIVPRSPPGIAAKDLPDLVREKLSVNELAELGSVTWYTTSVKLNMEVEGEIERVPGAKPQHLVLT